MTEKDDEFDNLLRNYRTLGPEERDRLVRCAIERAKASREETIRSLFRGLLGLIGRLAARMRQRAAAARLQKLDDRMLKDMGINRGEIETVVRRCNRNRPLVSCRGTRPSNRVGRAA